MIDNTSKHPNPEWLFGKNPGAIERQEVEGQKQLTESSQLPVSGVIDGSFDQAFYMYESLGIKVISPSENDPLFFDVVLPNGWKINPTSHPMWSDLVDQDGNKKGHIFYKAAFYDRNAFFRLAE